MEPAGALRRILAYLIDTIVTILLLIPFWIWYAAGLFGPESGIYLLGYGMLIPFVYGLVQWLYLSICWSTAARTLGMRITRTLVLVKDSEAKPGFFRSTLRYLGMVLSAGFFGIGFLPVLLSRDRASLHDLIASTVILRYDS